MIYGILKKRKPGISEEIPGLLEQNDDSSISNDRLLWYNLIVQKKLTHDLVIRVDKSAGLNNAIGVHRNYDADHVGDPGGVAEGYYWWVSFQ